MRIAMLARNPSLYSHVRLKEAAEARGHTLDIINTTRVYMNIASRRPEVYYNGEKLPRYDAVIPRIGASVTFYGMAVLRQFEMMGVYPVNESVAIGRSRDKLRSMQLLARDGIGLPVTTFAYDPKQTEEVVRLAGGAPLVIKLLEGTQGIGVVLADTDRSSQIGDRGVPGREHQHHGAGVHQGGRRHRHPRLRHRRQGGGGDETHGCGGRVPVEPASRRQRAGRAHRA
jgi:ribosomal protein S6--L-glutamate ligase